MLKEWLYHLVEQEWTDGDAGMAYFTFVWTVLFLAYVCHFLDIVNHILTKSPDLPRTTLRTTILLLLGSCVSSIRSF